MLFVRADLEEREWKWAGLQYEATEIDLMRANELWKRAERFQRVRRKNKTKLNLAGGPVAIYPVVNSMVSQTVFALQWVNPWSEAHCWLKCMNGGKGWSWGAIMRDRCRKRALRVFCSVANCSVWLVYPRGYSWRSLQPSERLLLIFVHLLQPRISSPLISTFSGCFPKQ